MTLVWKVLFWLKWSLLSVLITLVLVLALVSSLVSTQWGSRWVLNQAAQRLPLELGAVEGNLIEGLDISYLEFIPELEEGEPPQRYRVEGLSFRWRPVALLGRAVSIQSLSADSVLLVLPEGEEDEEPAEAITDWPDLALPVSIRLGDVELNNIRIEQGDTVTELQRVSGSIALGAFNLRVSELEVISEEYQASVNGRIGVRYPYTADLRVVWAYRLPMEDGEPLGLNGRGHLTGNVEEITLEHQLAAPLALSSVVRLQPRLDDAEQDPWLSLRNRWQNQSPPSAFWPEEQPVPVTSGELSVEGWLDAYRLALTTQVRTDDLPDLDARLSGVGSLEQFDIAEARVRMLDGVLDVSGLVTWLPGVTWDLNIDARELNPEVFLEDWPGVISAAFATRGELGDEGQLRARVQDLQLSGELRSIALAASGAVDYEGDRIQAEQLNLAMGSNTLFIDGYAVLDGEQMPSDVALDWSLEAPGLAELDPGLGGSLSAHGRVEGNLEDPRVRLSARGEDLRWQDEYHLESVLVDLDQIDPARFRVSVDARQITAAEQVIQQVLMQGSGSMADHSVETRVISEELGEITWVLAGGYDAERWQGEIRKLSLLPTEYPAVHLAAAAPLTLSADEVALGNFCLRPELPAWLDPDSERGAAELEARLCSRAQWRPEQGAQAEGEILALPLRLAHAFLPADVRVRGMLQGRFSFTAPPESAPSGRLLLETEGAEIHHMWGVEDADTYPIERFEVNATLQDNQIQATLLSDWGDYGDIGAELGLLLETGELDGKLTANFANLAPLEAMVPQLQDVTGELSAEFALGGTLTDPEVKGTAALADGSARVPEAGLDLENIGLRATADLNRITLEGEVSSGEGILRLEAALERLGEPDWQGQASLTGENFQALNTREITALLTPDLTLRVSAEELRLEGSATIPEARANIQTIPETATQVSGDVVVRQELEEEEAEPGIPVFVDLRLILGDEVHFEGFGLTSRLSGELGLLKTPTRDLFTTGEVGVAEGRYEAYGQDLTIERGRLIFQGPYDNPGLDIRAERTVEQYVVGLEIGGSLQSPRSRVFSTPTLPDSEAMAMLFTGRPLSGGSSADGNMLINAIGSLGLERSGFITEEIARTFGFDEVTIQTEDDVTESTLHIGKYLTPRLFVRYVVGLFDQTNKVGFRYDVTRNLHLEGESGVHQSVDVIFKIER
ncbi:translocation/assembly module TamB domain-containing protein [Marinimicrobium sp. ABcell2]|uniref:translocation/assembly module TamB domain-containing protein n=1 Tax=Marinimicrobium sp. ABcell2 TaxID=3069751 RepID=UPI0027B44D5C|nr:translocation/assembly module TamB domain-containing protein [Marinimicrobium sp. ABcell2]MDQ2075993.1 translocation/assembly module TamB domain-containing protein [Marinimicrobium sp. ABcell2]